MLMIIFKILSVIAGCGLLVAGYNQWIAKKVREATFLREQLQRLYAPLKFLVETE